VHEVDVDIFQKLGDKLKKLVDKSIKLVDKQSKVLDKSQNCFDKPSSPEKNTLSSQKNELPILQLPLRKSFTFAAENTCDCRCAPLHFRRRKMSSLKGSSFKIFVAVVALRYTFATEIVGSVTCPNYLVTNL